LKFIDQTFEILDYVNGNEILEKIELCGRVCYKSENKITPGSAEKFVKSIIESGHESVLEHVNLSVRVITDRGVSHEIVRHRIASYSQESTRYANYSKEKFKSEITYINPIDFTIDKEGKELLENIERYYIQNTLTKKLTPQQARYFLPNGLKTEIIMTMNLREWRHFFKLRTSKKAHPQMRALVSEILLKFKKKIPIVFDDIEGALKRH